MIGKIGDKLHSAGYKAASMGRKANMMQNSISHGINTLRGKSSTRQQVAAANTRNTMNNYYAMKNRFARPNSL